MVSYRKHDFPRDPFSLPPRLDLLPWDSKIHSSWRPPRKMRVNPSGKEISSGQLFLAWKIWTRDLFDRECLFKLILRCWCFFFGRVLNFYLHRIVINDQGPPKTKDGKSQSRQSLWLVFVDCFLRLDKLLNMNNDAFNLQEPVGFEVVSTDGEWVEFKIKCCLTDSRSCWAIFRFDFSFLFGTEVLARLLKKRVASLKIGRFPTLAGMVLV